MGKTVERTERSQEAVREVLAELRALPADAKLTRVESGKAQFDRTRGRLHCLRMAKTIEEKEQEREMVAQILAELRALPPGSLTGDQWLSFVKRLPKPDLPEGWSSADDIRELRGPLPEDDPEYQRNILGRR